MKRRFEVGHLSALLGIAFFACAGCASVGPAPRLNRIHGASTPEVSGADDNPVTIVLVHGLGRSRLSMGVLIHRLKKTDYQIKNFRYSTAGNSMDELSGQLKKFIKDEVKTPEYHLVAHSLGNVIIRNGFDEPYPDGLGRIVMLAPPNHPAKLAQKFGRLWPYRWFAGDSGQKLSDPAFYDALPVPDVEFGIIAGDKGLPLLKGPDDGVVALRSTILGGMTDWVSVHRTHTLVMTAKETPRLALNFLREGRFGAEDPKAGLAAITLNLRASVSSPVAGGI